MQGKFRVLTAIAAGSLALATVGIGASSGTGHKDTHPALAAQTQSFPAVNLDACPALHTGSSSAECVAQLQTDLNSIPGNHLVVDGTFGSQTYNAVIAFQEAHGLKQDGIAGTDTKMALDAALSVPTPTVPAATSPANAMSGNVPDKRAPNVAGEITAMYWHGVNRSPDSGGFNQYMWFANQNCRWGVLSASFQILNSAEAHDVWRNNPQTLAGMLYAALLNRPPDEDGLRTYTTAITQLGLPWATASMMASPEYNARLAGICPSPDETATMYTWQEAKTFRDTLLKLAANEGTFCFGKKAVDKVLDLRSKEDAEPTVDNPIGEILTVAYSITNKIVADYKLDGTCGAMKAYLMAALKVFETYRGGAGDNPVFVEYSVGKASFWTHQKPFTVRVGPNPTSWTGYSGKSW